MYIKYYRSDNLKYSSRKRRLNLGNDLVPFAEEEQRSVRLGDGATTFIRTSSDNICDYVTIDGTRWFVIDYQYLNGKQVQLNLQRDVVGQFGLSGAYGKIERGYTDSILKYRKELSLNEVLKERIPIKSKSNTYGNITVSTHENEKWGVLYFTRDSKEDKVSINIPAFSPAYETVGFPNVGTKYREERISCNCGISMSVRVKLYISVPEHDDIFMGDYHYVVEVLEDYAYGEWTTGVTANRTDAQFTSLADEIFPWVLRCTTTASALGDMGIYEKIAHAAALNLGVFVSQNMTSDGYGYSRPSYKTLESIPIGTKSADGKNYKIENDVYSYSISNEEDEYAYGNTNYRTFAQKLFDNYGVQSFSEANGVYGRVRIESYSLPNMSTSGELTGYGRINSYFEAGTFYYSRTLIPHSEAGIIDIPMTMQFVDEPYSCLVFPLYDVTINLSSPQKTKRYVVEQKSAFDVFNNVIEALSGENGFLVDAQIYPYCPIINDEQASLKASGTQDEYPFFSILSTYFTTDCDLLLQPYLDVKKEYISRKYSIVSPEQSSRFSFNFYDYVNEFVPDGDKNNASITIRIKTALKPFAIISSAVILRKPNSRGEVLMGINYESDLKGSQPSSNGFECSLASSAFETYKRENSNYQALFALDKEELERNQQVERVNEATQFAMNMITGTAFGAIAGAEIADAGIWNSFGAKAAGAGIGAGIAAATIGTAGGIQLATNDSLREYERTLQQQRFDLTIGTIKNLPNSINRISSFNEIIMREFYYVVEIYQCTDFELTVVDNFISQYGYGIGVYDFFSNYNKNGWFLKGSVVKSNLAINLHNILTRELEGGIYIYE